MKQAKVLFCILIQILLVSTASSNDLRANKKGEVTFRLYTRDNSKKYINLYTGNLKDITLDPNKPFKIISHGYIHSADSTWVQTLKNSYLKKEDYNIILVDWRKPARNLITRSAKYSKVLGVDMAQLVIDLNNTLKVNYENIHLIGHSFGAHAAGFAGKYMLKNVGKTVPRITGLDPAGMMFNGVGPDERLSVGDAGFVDNIHSDGHEYGSLDQIGDIDFYPNGGDFPQPGCLPIFLCSHVRAAYFLSESIFSNGFIAKKCSSYKNYKKGLCQKNQTAIMGEYVDQNLRGRFYLRTRAFSPYAKYGQI